MKYDSYDTEGLIADDMIEAISATYGISTDPSPGDREQQPYGEQLEVLARSQDPSTDSI